MQPYTTYETERAVVLAVNLEARNWARSLRASSEELHVPSSTLREPLEKGTTVTAFNNFRPERIRAMNMHGILAYFGLLAPWVKSMEPDISSFFEESLMHLRRGSRTRDVWVLDDNARLHWTSIVEAGLTNNNIQRWFQPPYSPNLSLFGYGYFHVFKRAVGGVHATKRDFLVASNSDIVEGRRYGESKAV